ncbi:MAG: DHH family phosphoesterase [Lachnospiraceae bacterium]|jgi:c-di-AMP phosphodiesterase-like protein|nr:DHH family phosphoesterase [Lachnospiraceae bacterium]
MKQTVKLKGNLKRYLQTSVYLGVLLILFNGLVFWVDRQAGLILTCFTVFYFAVVLSVLFYNRPIIVNELVNFATQYGQIQKTLLYELELPYAILDDGGRMIWANRLFEKITHKGKNYHKHIASIFPDITPERLPAENDEESFEMDYQNCIYTVTLKKVPIKDLTESSNLLEAEDFEGYLIALYLFDTTALSLAIQEVDDQSLAVGMIYLDNYDEALESIEEVRRSLLIALIDRKVNKYVSSHDGICKKLEKDKYLIILRKKALGDLKEQRFDILEDVKTVNIGNEMNVTISIGIGLDGLSYTQTYEFSRNAIDLALGRGGDQAVIKTPDNISYFGGKSQQVERNTRVKARVKALALREIITARERVLIMGHRIADVDSFGAAIGIYRIATALERKAHIIVNEVTTSVYPLIELFKGNPEYEEDMIISSQQAMELADAHSVLVVIDVNRPSITECPELLRMCKSIVVLDHHRQGTEIIENASLSYVEVYASSSCEMVAEILQYIGENIPIRSEEADCLYSGIMIDTNNFVTKTGVRTFEAAAYLRRSGADVTRVRKLFREDAHEYKAKADAVSQADIYRGAYAISTCTSEDIQSPTIIGAQAANELLNIKGVKASFILTDYQNCIYVSARSIDEVNVQVIMERMGGGGHMNVAGCQMEGIPIEEGIGALKRTLDAMIDGGEL